MFVQQVLNGLLIGSVYALFALGFTLVFGVMNILNLAHGAVFACGAFVGLYAVMSLDLPVALALVLAMAAGAVVSLSVDFVAFRPLRMRRADEFGAIVTSIGASLILLSVLQQVSEARIMTFPFGTFPIQIYRFWGLRISLLQISVAACAVVSIGLLVFYLYGTRFGRKVRAAAVNARTASLLGVNTDAVYVQVFLIAGALAGAAGVMIGLMLNSIHFLMGESMMLRAFVVVILGGLGSIHGAVVSGLLIGLTQTLLVTYVSSRLGDALLFSLLFIVLLFYPTGFFGGLRSDAKVKRA